MNVKYECPECGEISNKSEWKESEVGCEVCYSHTAIICPKCGELYDTILNFEDDLIPASLDLQEVTL